MKDHLQKLLQYDRYTNLQILESIFAANQPQNMVKLMAHLLVAQQVWLSRCQSTPAPVTPLWPDWQAVQLKYIIEQSYTGWLNHLNGITNDDISNTISYYNTKGEAFNNTFLDIFTHMINHGTHHRAQIGLQLKQAGLVEPPVTDYIYFVRNGLSNL
jgi:uncharacterized damage-inducible protein DinB